MARAGVEGPPQITVVEEVDLERSRRQPTRVQRRSDVHRFRPNLWGPWRRSRPQHRAVTVDTRFRWAATRHRVEQYRASLRLARNSPRSWRMSRITGGAARAALLDAASHAARDVCASRIPTVRSAISVSGTSARLASVGFASRTRSMPTASLTHGVDFVRMEATVTDVTTRRLWRAVGCGLPTSLVHRHSVAGSAEGGGVCHRQPSSEYRPRIHARGSSPKQGRHPVGASSSSIGVNGSSNPRHSALGSRHSAN